MLFAAGIGVGMFYYGAAEPILHYAPGEYGNRFWGRYVPDQPACNIRNSTNVQLGVFLQKKKNLSVF